MTDSVPEILFLARLHERKRPAVFAEAARRIAQSGRTARFTVVGGAIRFGLAAVKNVGGSAVDSILDARKKGGRFTSIFDFGCRVDSRLVNKKVFESLICGGAFDSLGFRRAQLMASVERAIERAAEAQRDRRQGQGSFFDVLEGPRGGNGAGEELPDVPEWPENRLLAQEKALLGFYVSGHPLARFGGEIKRFATASTETLSAEKDGATVKLGGIIAKVRVTFTRRQNKKMAVAVLEDLDGTVEILVVPRVYEQAAPLIVEEAAVLVTGRVSVEGDNPKVIADEIMPLEEAQQRCTAAMYVTVHLSDIERGKLDELKNLLEGAPGACPVFLDFASPTGERVLMKTGRQFRVTPSRELVRGVETVLGESSVRLTA